MRNGSGMRSPMPKRRSASSSAISLVGIRRSGAKAAKSGRSVETGVNSTQRRDSLQRRNFANRGGRSREDASSRKGGARMDEIALRPLAEGGAAVLDRRATPHGPLRRLLRAFIHFFSYHLI